MRREGVPLVLLALFLMTGAVTGHGNQTDDCKYGDEEIGLCDNTTDTRVVSRQLIINESTGNDCPSYQNKTKPCSYGCKYNHSVEWDKSECDVEGADLNVAMATKTMVLVSGPEDCEASKTVTKTCVKLKRKGRGKKGNAKKNKQQKNAV